MVYKLLGGTSFAIKQLLTIFQDVILISVGDFVQFITLIEVHMTVLFLI